jgi:hypothetical protein
MSHIFISYSKKDIEFARHLKWLLEAQGFQIWMDEKGIDPSDDWWETIEASVVNCMALVVIMSDNSRHSRWVRREVLLAENLSKPLFPVLLGGQVWTQLADIQSADMTAGVKSDLPDEFLRALRQAIKGKSKLPDTVQLPRPVQPKKPRRRGLWIGVALGALALIAVALLALATPSATTETPTPFDPVREAERLITETELARIAFLTTPNHTQTVEAILNRFLTETSVAAVTNTPVPTDTLVPTDTPIPTDTLRPTVRATEEEAGGVEVFAPDVSPTRTATMTFTTTLSPTPQPSNTPTSTATPNVQQTTTSEAELAATLLQSARDEQATLAASCPGSPLPARLRIGITARVTEGGLPSRLRAAPDTAAEQLETIPQLEAFEVVGGPECDEAQQLRWWQVDYQGTVGWVAEGVGDEYYLEEVE